MKKIKLFLLLIISVNLNNNNEILAKADTISNNNLEKLRLIEKDEIIIDQIIITGNKRTKENIITRELSLKLGIPITKKNLIPIIEEDKRKVINTNLFNEVNFSLEIIRDNYLILNIDVIESLYWNPTLIFELSDRNFNDWWQNFNHDIKRINYGITVNNNIVSLDLFQSYEFTENSNFHYTQGNEENLSDKEKKLCDLQIKKNYKQKDCKKWKPKYCSQ